MDVAFAREGPGFPYGARKEPRATGDESARGSANVWVGKRPRATKKRGACHEVRRDGPGGDGTDMMQKQKWVFARREKGNIWEHKDID